MNFEDIVSTVLNYKAINVELTVEGDVGGYLKSDIRRRLICGSKINQKFSLNLKTFENF